MGPIEKSSWTCRECGGFVFAVYCGFKALLMRQL